MSDRFAKPNTKERIVELALKAKEKSGKTFDEIAQHLGYTNCYVAQIFYGSAPIEKEKVSQLKEIVPDLSDELLREMQKFPFRSWDPSIVHEPHIYRMLEATHHYGVGIKSIINEKFGDGIMSAIDFYVTVDKAKGTKGEDRVIITMNGKYLPYAVQHTKDNVVKAKL